MKIQVKTLLEDLTDTRPGTLVPEALVSRKGRETKEESGWEKKNKTSRKEETSDNIRR